MPRNKKSWVNMPYQRIWWVGWARVYFWRIFILQGRNPKIIFYRGQKQKWYILQGVKLPHLFLKKKTSINLTILDFICSIKSTLFICHFGFLSLKSFSKKLKPINKLNCFFNNPTRNKFLLGQNEIFVLC